MFMTAIPALVGDRRAGVGWILDQMNGAYGLAGWQWLFLIEGLPSIAIGFACLAYLDDGPRAGVVARRDECAALLAASPPSGSSVKAVHTFTLREALTNRRVLALSLVYFGIVSGNYGLGVWLPSIVADVARSAGLDAATGIRINTLTGVLVAVPYAFAVVAMILWTRRSDRTGERVWHVAGPSLLGGISLAASAQLADPWLAALALTLAAVCTYAALPTFWTLPTAFLTGSAAAAGIALVNSIGNLGGLRRPYLLGWLQATRFSERGSARARRLLWDGGRRSLAWVGSTSSPAPEPASARSGDAASRSPRS
jgi:MFS family permease